MILNVCVNTYWAWIPVPYNLSYSYIPLMPLLTYKYINICSSDIIYQSKTCESKICNYRADIRAGAVYRRFYQQIPKQALNLFNVILVCNEID